MERMYCVYILKCADDSYYVGVTNNLDRRLSEHTAALHPESYTASRLPVSLVYCEVTSYILDAIAREKQLKGWCRAKKEALITGTFDDLPKLAVRYSGNENGRIRRVTLSPARLRVPQPDSEEARESDASVRQ